MSGKAVKAYKVGDFAEITYSVTAEDIQKFGDLTGDDNPIHFDRKFAERTSLKGVVAHGMLSASFISTIIGKYIPGPGALWLSQNLEFLLPVRVGDELKIRSTVTKVHQSQGVLELQTEILNQFDQKVLSGNSRVKALDVEEEAASSVRSEAPPKVALVTGATRGIGAATALRLARDGYAVVVNYRADAEGAAAVVDAIAKADGKAVAAQADVTDASAVDAMIKSATRRFGPITALVNNAGDRIIHKAFAEFADQEIQRSLDLFFMAPLNLIRAVLPSFEKAGAGAVVNVGTIFTDNVPTAQLLPYISAKSALVSATRSLALEYGPKGYRFNIVSPGMTDTALIADVPEKARIMAKMQTPLRRLATVDDVANGIAFLLSPSASHITGETLRICGGSVMV